MQNTKCYKMTQHDTLSGGVKISCGSQPAITRITSLVICNKNIINQHYRQIDTK